MEFPSHIWRKATRTTETGQCVEVALTTEQIGVRDSKNRAAGHFEVSPTAWSAFVGQIKTGGYDQ